MTKGSAKLSHTQRRKEASAQSTGAERGLVPLAEARKQETLPEEKESLWLLTVSPGIWAAHFLLSYWTAAIWCAKRGSEASLSGVRVAIVLYTLVALAGIGLNARTGYRRHRHENGRLPHDFDSPEDRHRFLGFATFLLALLSGVATLYAALVAVFFWDCH